MSDRTSELREAEERAREFTRVERDATIRDQLNQIDRIGRALATQKRIGGGTEPRR